MIIFLEDVSWELNKIHNIPEYKEIIYDNNKNKIKQEQLFTSNFQSRKKSIITNLFYSQIITKFKCQFKKEAYFFQILPDQSFLIPENTKHIKIEELLNIYFNLEMFLYINV